MYDIGDESTDVALSLHRVQGPELRGTSLQMGVRSEDASASFTLSTNAATHLCPLGWAKQECSLWI